MKHPALIQYDYHKWANNRIFERLNDLPDEIYDRKIKSVFSSIREVMTHVYRTDGMWLSVMSGDPFAETMNVIKQLEKKSTGQDPEGMQNLYAGMSGQYETFFRNRGDLDKVISIEHPRYGKLETSVSQLVKHVVNHGTYHRGNITAMLRQQGHAGAPTDYIFYLYDIAE